MEIAALLLTLGVIILVGLYLYAPFLERRSSLATQEEHEVSALMAERDRVINSLQELDFDFKLGKIPEEDYPAQRAHLLQRGADILKRLDEVPAEFHHEDSRKRRERRFNGRSPAPSQSAEDRIEQAIAARRADPSLATVDVTDDGLESMIIARRKERREKSAGFCPKCGKPVVTSDRFCPSCGKSLT